MGTTVRHTGRQRLTTSNLGVSLYSFLVHFYQFYFKLCLKAVLSSLTSRNKNQLICVTSQLFHANAYLQVSEGNAAIEKFAYTATLLHIFIFRLREFSG